MERKIHELQQGTPEWDAFRLDHFGASEAAAMLGLSSKIKRSELLRAKHTGIAKEFSAWFQENVLDRGHDAEAMARPIVESMIGGQDLYPATYSYGKLSASCDGLTMDGEIAFEHKQYNAELALAIRDGYLPDEYQPQCQQVMYVTGAKKLIFVCSNGTPEKFESIEVLPDPAWVSRILAGWEQFAKDLAEYQVVETAAEPVAAQVAELPALNIQITGSVVASNLDAWKEAVVQRITAINTNLQTDQDFADADAMVKFLDAGEKRLDVVKSQAQANAADIDQVFRAIDEIKATMKAKRLELDKLVERRKAARKDEIVAGGRKRLSDHLAGLNVRLGRVQMPAIQADFAAAIKGKRSFAAMQDAVDTLLANKKIESNEIADRIDANLKTIAAEAEHAFLFSDVATLAMKQADDLALVIRTRIADHKADQERRLEAERERIRREEEARAAAKIKAEADAEDALIASIWRNARRIEADTVPYIEKAIVGFDVAAQEFDRDPRPRVVSAISEARKEMHEKLAAAKLRAEQEEADRQRRAAEEAAARIERDRLKPSSQVATDGAAAVASAGAEPAAKSAPKAAFASIDTRTVLSKPARMTRPTDADIIATLSEHYRVHESSVISWLLDMDLKAASDRMSKEFAA